MTLKLRPSGLSFATWWPNLPFTFTSVSDGGSGYARHTGAVSGAAISGAPVSGYVPLIAAALDAAAGTFTYTGQAAGLLHAQYTLAAAVGTFTYTGQATGSVFSFSATHGAFSYTGQDLALRLKYRLLLAAGAFSYAGQVVNLYATQGVDVPRVPVGGDCGPAVPTGRFPTPGICAAPAPTPRFPAPLSCEVPTPILRAVCLDDEPPPPPTCVDPTGWAAVAPMPVATGQNYGVVVGDYFYVFGGSTVVGGSGASNRVQRYNRLTDTWDQPTVMPQGGQRELCAGAMPNGKIFVGGGTNGSSWSTAVQWYDPTTNTWEAKNNLPFPWVDGRMDRLPDGRMLISGGSKQSMNLPRITDTYIYDPALDTYTVTGSLHAGKGNHILLTMSDGRLLSTTGTGNPNNVADATTELYDPATGLWTVVAPIPHDAPRTNYPGAFATPCGNAYVWGGSDVTLGGNNTNKVFKYDLALDSWSEIDPLPIAVGGVAYGQFADGKYITAGGFSGGAMSATVFMTP